MLDIFYCKQINAYKQIERSQFMESFFQKLTVPMRSEIIHYSYFKAEFIDFHSVTKLIVLGLITIYGLKQKMSKDPFTSLIYCGITSVHVLYPGKSYYQYKKYLKVVYQFLNDQFTKWGTLVKISDENLMSQLQPYNLLPFVLAM
ncbi:Hypothetical_protein [Hexamita inflata]|uniref:Hypothetical_protein n=1 Tax=Hexamita inflata TaxID=28002 RepID=A0ABP1GFN6_9EUKA